MTQTPRLISFLYIDYVVLLLCKSLAYRKETVNDISPCSTSSLTHTLTWHVLLMRLGVRRSCSNSNRTELWEIVSLLGENPEVWCRKLNKLEPLQDHSWKLETTNWIWCQSWDTGQGISWSLMHTLSTNFRCYAIRSNKIDMMKRSFQYLINTPYNITA